MEADGLAFVFKTVEENFYSALRLLLIYDTILFSVP
jgi:hypothetical protein